MFKGNYTFKSSRVPSRVMSLVKEANSRKLHMGYNGVMRDWYMEHIRYNHEYIDTIAVAYDSSGKAIGAAVVTPIRKDNGSDHYSYKGEIAVYVMTKHRNKGVGTELYKKAIASLRRWDMIEPDTDKYIVVSPHDLKSHKLFNGLKRQGYAKSHTIQWH